MKNAGRKIGIAIVLTLVLAAVAAGGAAAAVGQEVDTEQVDRWLDLVRTDIKKQRVALIGQAMGFTGEEAAAFWPIYQQYEADADKLGDERIALIRDYAANYGTMTDEKAHELAMGALSLEEHRTALKRQYFEKIEAELSSVVAARFIQVERQLNMLLDLQIASEIPLIQRPQ